MPGVPGRDTARPGAGTAGQAERDRPAPAAPVQRPPPAPAPGLTVLVVLEVVVGAGPAAALGRVLHVVELQKVRPLAREAQEGGGQAPRQGHQPPGAGERREGAEENVAGPSLPQDGQRPGNTGLEEPPLSWRAPLPRPGRCDAVPAVRALRGPSSAALERGAPRPPVLARRPAGPAAPVLPAPSGQVQRRPGGRVAQSHGPCRGPSRRGGEKSGSRPGSAPLAPFRILALLLPRLPTGPSERACGGDPLSLPDLPRREKALWPSQRLQAAAAPHRTAGGTQSSCSPALPPAQRCKSGERRAQKTWPTPALCPSGPGEGSTQQAAPFLLLFSV